MFVQLQGGLNFIWKVEVVPSRQISIWFQRQLGYGCHRVFITCLPDNYGDVKCCVLEFRANLVLDKLFIVVIWYTLDCLQ